MGIKMRIVLTTAVLAVAIFAVASGQSMSCTNEEIKFLRICNDMNTATGLQSCCAILTQDYRTDRPCLCLIAGSANFSDDKLVQLLNGCGEIIAAGTPVCSADPSPPPDLYSPPSDLYPPPSDFYPPEPPSDLYTSPPHPVVSRPSPARPPPPNRRSPVEKNVNDSPSKSQLSKGTLIGIIVGALAFLSLLILLFALILRKRNYSPPPQGSGNPQESVPVQLELQGQQPQINQTPVTPSMKVDVSTLMGSSCTIFTYEELVKATDGFGKHNLLGSGSFGDVHRGTLPNGRQVAIKQLNPESWQGRREFKNEIEIISRVHHNNLVSLVGYCSTDTKKLLVYELVPNGTLESHLHDDVKMGSTMDWSKRMKVALGSAKGLAYLHEECYPQIIHRDIKAANILLDNDFVAKVADLGLAKEVDDATNATTRIVGTFGYLAPEYALGGQPTDKSDVYSFGVILLELITGRRPLNSAGGSNKKSLVDWARPLLSEALMNGNCDAVVDERLQKNYNSEEMVRLIGCCASCIHHSADYRPSMSRVVRILEGLVPIEELKQGVQQNPSFSISSASFGYESGHQSNTGMRSLDGSRVRSENHTSASYSATSGDYNDHNPFPYTAKNGR